VTNVAYGKNSRDAGFRQIEIAVERPSLGALAAAHQIISRKDESALVALDHACEPIREGRGANEREERGARLRGAGIDRARALGNAEVV